MIAFMVGEPSKTRYAVSEARAAYESFKDSEDDRKRLMDDMKLEFKGGTIDLTEYLKLVERIAKNDCKWLLVNRRADDGRVVVEEPERKELLAEKIMLKVASLLELKRIPPEVARMAKEFKTAFSSATEVKLDGELTAEGTPPCIGNILALLESGQATHNMMFILGTYLAGLGLPEDRIVGVFSKSPSFDEGKTRYQLKFLTGERGSTKYSCPSCSKIKSYGLCRQDCGVKHPLQYGKKPT
jgi:DNA primase large subunit